MGGYSKLTVNLSVDVNVTDNLSMLYNAQFFQGMDGEVYGDAYPKDNVIYHNVSATYHMNDQWSVNGGIKNLLDADPQYVTDGNDINILSCLYDVVGRTLFLSTSYKF